MKTDNLSLIFLYIMLFKNINKISGTVGINRFGSKQLIHGKHMGILEVATT